MDIRALLIAHCKATVGKTLQRNGHRVRISKTAGMAQNRDALLCNCVIANVTLVIKESIFYIKLMYGLLG